MPVNADPDLALRLAKATVDLYAAAVADLLRIVARRLERGIDRPGWAERKLVETAQMRDEAQAVVDRLTTAGPAEIRAAIEAAHTAGAAQGAADLRQTGLPAGSGRGGSLAVDALVEETVVGVQQTHGQILRSTDDIYRSVVAEAAGTPLTGATTRRQAAQQALNRFAMAGITGFTDRTGRSWNLASYAEMAMRTTVGRAQIAGTLDRFRHAGQDIVIVSDAPGECRLCRPFELRLLSVSGGSVGQTVDGRTVVDSVAGARSRGLFHANCRHSVGLFVPGLTQPAPAHGTADPAGDLARQELRRLERGVRQWKQRQAVAVTPQAERLAKAKVAEWQAGIRAHIDRTGLLRQSAREQLGAR